MEWFTTIALNVVFAIAILIVGWLLAGWVARQIEEQAARRPNLDDMLFSFLATMARYAVLVITGVIVLDRFGVETTAIIAVLGAAGLAVGLALQGTLSNVAAGVMILFLRPFRTGDYIEAAGKSGTVKAVSLFTTELTTPDNRCVIAPNNAIWSGGVVNYSRHPTRRLEIVVGVAYEADLAKADAALHAAIADEPRVLAEPAPVIKVTALNASSVDFTIRAWVARADLWATQADLTRAVKEALDEAGVEIPFNTVTVMSGAPEGAAA